MNTSEYHHNSSSSSILLPLLHISLLDILLLPSIVILFTTILLMIHYIHIHPRTSTSTTSISTTSTNYCSLGRWLARKPQVGLLQSHLQSFLHFGELASQLTQGVQYILNRAKEPERKSKVQVYIIIVVEEHDDGL